MGDETDNLILKKLEEYGDSVIGVKNKKKKDRNKGVDINTSGQSFNSKSALKSSAPCSERQKKNRRKKKKKECDNDNQDESEDVDEETNPPLSGHERRLQEMSEQLGLAEFKQEMNITHTKEEVGDAKKTPVNQPEVVVFTSHKSKKAKKAEEKREKLKDTIGQEFDMRQARFDVQKFGIKGFHGNEKEEAMKALLIKLGAKPPKNKYLNYKEYQENKKQQMLEEKQKREMDRKLGYKIPKANRGKKRSRDKNDIGHLDGQVGMWKSGVQVVKKDDLKGFKKSKLK